MCPAASKAAAAKREAWKYHGNEVKLDGTEYIIMCEDDVLGILDVTAKPSSKAK